MRRRDLILAVGATATGLMTRAQSAATPVVGVLSTGSASGHEKLIEALRDGLVQQGYADGKNVTIEFRWAGDDYLALGPLAAEFVKRPVNLIVAANLPSAVAAVKATTTIPIVFVIGDDPIKHGLAASLSRPGGNATGVSMLVAGLVAKRLELLREMVPHAALVAVLINPTNPNAGIQISEMERASREVGQRIELFKAGTEHEVELAVAALVERGAQALVVGADPFFYNRRTKIVGLAARYTIPGIYEWREFAEAGGLASYGPNLFASDRQLGVYAGRILKGDKPSDLPVMQPTRFELAINLRTAKALGLTIPASILARADEVIE